MLFVGHHGRVPDEEWLLEIGFDEFEDRLHGLQTDHQPRVAMTTFGGHAVGETAIGVMSLPELAGLEASVASVPEQPWHGRGVSQKGKHGASVHALGRIVATNP